MSSESVHPDPQALECDLLRYQVLNSLTVISARTQLLQRMAHQAPGLNALERTALLNGLAAILASAHELGRSLEVVIGQDGHPAPITLPAEEPC